MRRCLQSSQLHMVTCDFASPHPAILYFVGALEALWILRGPLYFGGSSVRASMKWRCTWWFQRWVSRRFDFQLPSGRVGPAILRLCILRSCVERARGASHTSQISHSAWLTQPRRSASTSAAASVCSFQRGRRIFITAATVSPSCVTRGRCY